MSRFLKFMLPASNKRMATKVNPMQARLSALKGPLLQTSMSQEFVNDVKTGWVINKINTQESYILFGGLLHALLRENLVAPTDLYRAWIYIIARQNPNKKLLKEMKFFSMPPKFDGDKIQNYLPSLLNAIIPIFNEYRSIESKDSTILYKNVDGLFKFVLESAVNLSEVNFVAEEYQKIPKELRSAFLYTEILQKLILFHSPLEDLMEYFRKMIIEDRLYPENTLLDLLRAIMTRYRGQNDDIGYKVLQSLHGSRNELIDLIAAGFLDAGDYKSARELALSCIEDKKLSPTMMGHIILKSFNRSTDSPTAEVYNLVVKVMPQLRLKFPEKVIHHIPDDSKKNYYSNKHDVFVAIMRGLGSREMLYEAKELFDSAESYGFKKSAALYNAIIQTYLLTRPPEFRKAKRLLKELKNLGFEANIRTITAMILAYCKAGHREMAVDVLNRWNGPPHLAIYTVAIQTGLAYQGISNPSELFSEMTKYDIKPDSKFFSVWISRACKDGNLPEAIRILDASRQFISPTFWMYTILVDGAVKMKMLPVAERLVDAMEDDMCRPTTQTYSTLMLGYLETGDLNLALYYYSKMIGYSFVTGNSVKIRNRQKADNNAIRYMFSALQKNSVPTDVIELIYRKTVVMGFRPRTVSKAIEIEKLLLDNNHIWPAVLIPTYQHQLDIENAINRAIQIVNSFGPIDLETPMIDILIERLYNTKSLHDYFRELCFDILTEENPINFVDTGLDVDSMKIIFSNFLVYSLEQQLGLQSKLGNKEKIATLFESLGLDFMGYSNQLTLSKHFCKIDNFSKSSANLSNSVFPVLRKYADKNK